MVLTGNRLVLLSRRASLRIELGHLGTEYLGACSFRSWVAWPDGFSECCGSERQDCIKRRVKGEREYGWILIFDICTVGIHSFLGRYLELVWVEID